MERCSPFLGIEEIAPSATMGYLLEWQIRSGAVTTFNNCFWDVYRGQLPWSGFTGRLTAHTTPPMTLESSPRRTSWGSLVRELWETWTRPSQHTAGESPEHPPQRHAFTNGVHSSNRARLSDRRNKPQLLPAARVNVMKKVSQEKSKLRKHRRVLPSEPPEKPYGLSSF